MKIALINASPKVKNSASGVFLKDLRRSIADKAETEEIILRKPSVGNDAVEKLKGCDVWVFLCPLYVDGLPSHLLSCLIELKDEAVDKRVYGVLNCGFYEGEQNEFALKILKNWCVKSNAEWRGGIGVGACGCIETFKDAKPGKSPKKTIENLLDELKDYILSDRFMEIKYTSVGMPKFVYKTAAEIGWRLKIKANGGKIKDLPKRY